MNVPEEAVQAAHAAICEQRLDDCLDPDWRGKCVKAVEAAAPHILSADWRRIPLQKCQECPKLVPAAQERCNCHERKDA